jgi:ESF2/ABP1 family protein
MPADPRFAFDTRFQATEEDRKAVASGSGSGNDDSEPEDRLSQEGNEEDEDERDGEGEEEGDEDATDDENFNGENAKVVKPLTPEALKAFNAAQARTGVVYISRIPPGMRPTKVRHLMSQHGKIGRVYLQQEGVYNWLLIDPSTHHFFRIFSLCHALTTTQACHVHPLLFSTSFNRDVLH